jgi:putative endonuclease
MPTPKARVKRSASRGLTRTWKKWILILLVVLLLIPAMQVAVVRFIRVKGFAPRGCRGRKRADVYVYILRSERDSGFYIGFSTNLRARLRQHQESESFATSHRGPWKLIYYEAYLNQEDALGREKYLKSGSGRRFLKAQLKHYLLQEPLARPRRPAV